MAGEGNRHHVVPFRGDYDFDTYRTRLPLGEGVAMTMRNVPSAQTAREALRASAHEAIARSRDVRTRLAELGTEEDEINIGHRVALQAVHDDMTEAQEEAAQLDAVLGEPARAVPSSQPADTTSVAPAPPAQPPTDPQPAPAAPPAVSRQETHVFRVTHIHHSAVQLFFAFVGLVIGLIVAGFTKDPVFNDVHGAGHDVLVVFWFIAFAVAGVFFGGWFGWFVEEHSADDEHDDEEEPTP